MKKTLIILFLFSISFSSESYLSFYGAGERLSNLNPSSISLGWSNLFDANNYLNTAVLSNLYSSDLVRLSMGADFNFNFINDFQKTDITDAKIKQAMDLCDIKNLSKLEDSQGFHEKLLNEEKFFRKGLVDEWKSKLEEHQVKKIEKAFFKEMKELKYL